MKRFGYKRTKSPYFTLLFSVLLFVLILVILSVSMNALAVRTKAEQKKSLQSALTRRTVECYAAEGFYPASLDYLKTHYGFTYDSNVFFVDYQPIGENIFPEITVIVREERK